MSEYREKEMEAEKMSKREEGEKMQKPP